MRRIAICLLAAGLLAPGLLKAQEESVELIDLSRTQRHPQTPQFTTSTKVMEQISTGGPEEEAPQLIREPAHAERYDPDSLRGSRDVHSIVIHTLDNGNSTTVQGATGQISGWKTKPGSDKEKRAAHYLVHRDGRIYEAVDPKHVAYHASYFNRHSIGIECDWISKDPMDTPWPKPLVDSLVRLVRWLCQKWSVARYRSSFQATDPVYKMVDGNKVLDYYEHPVPLTSPGIFSHQQLDPARRGDPGAMFPFDPAWYPWSAPEDTFIWRLNQPPRVVTAGPGVENTSLNLSIDRRTLPRFAAGRVTFEWEPIHMSDWDWGPHEVTAWEFSLSQSDPQDPDSWIVTVFPALAFDIISVTHLLPPGVYNWRVRAYNKFGWSKWSWRRYFVLQ